MELSVTKSNLQKAVHAVQKAVSTKPTLEILRNIGLKASNGILRISATDLEISISTFIGVDLFAEGSTTVSAKTFADFISLLPEGNIRLKMVDNELKVEAEKTTSKFSTIPYDEFPTLPTINEDASLLFKADKEMFKKALSLTTFVADRGIRQPVFSGILFEASPQKLQLVATDGFRLSKYGVPVQEDVEQKITPVVPYVSLDHVVRLGEDSDDENVEVYLVSKNNQILFKTGRTEISSNLLDGDFPNYNAILPQKHICSYRVHRDELMDSVRLSNVFSRQEDASRIKFKKQAGETQLTLFSRVAEIGEYESQVQVEIINEEDSIEIDFSPKKVIDILSRVTTEQLIIDVVLHPRTEHRMIIVKEEGND
ncbi:MAG: DNA polymerase III subunit beta, partial [Candidatus Dojkabacteria bacterium]